MLSKVSSISYNSLTYTYTGRDNRLGDFAVAEERSD